MTERATNHQSLATCHQTPSLASVLARFPIRGMGARQWHGEHGGMHRFDSERRGAVRRRHPVATAVAHGGAALLVACAPALPRIAGAPGAPAAPKAPWTPPRGVVPPDESGPFAAFGAMVTLILFGLELDIYGFVGMIMLIGIVEKNAIMMIDFALDSAREGKRTPREAIVEAASVRFRPIMMTTIAALMGALPIAVGWGVGASSRRPLGVAVVGGLAFSQLVTLYVTPVFYTYLDEFQGWMARARKPRLRVARVAAGTELRRTRRRTRRRAARPPAAFRFRNALTRSPLLLVPRSYSVPAPTRFAHFPDCRQIQICSFPYVAAPPRKSESSSSTTYPHNSSRCRISYR